MDKLENEYHDRFHDKQLPDDGFDAEGLWGAIEVELDEKPERKGFVWWKTAAMLLAFLLVAIAGGAIFYQNYFLNKNATIGANIQQNEAFDGEKSGNLTAKEGQGFDKNLAEADAANDASNDVSNDLNNNKNGAETAAKVVRKNSSVTNFESTNDANSTIADSFSNKNEIAQKMPQSDVADLIFKDKKTKTTAPTEDAFSQNDEHHRSPLSTDDPKTNLLIMPTIQQLKPLLVPSVWLSADEKKLSRMLAVTPPKADEDNNDSRKILLTGGAFGGANFTFLNFKSTTVDNNTIAQQKNAAERGFIGFTSGIELAAVRKNWRVKTGLQYHFLQTEFVATTTENYLVTRENALRRVRISEATGEVLSSDFEDTEVEGTETRQVVNYNQYQLFSIPLGAEYRRQRGRWSYGVGMGLSCQFLANQEGKTLDENGAIMEFTRADAPTLLANFGMLIHADASVGYQLSNRLNLTISPNYMWSRNKIFHNNLRSELHLVSIQLGLQAEF